MTVRQWFRVQRAELYAARDTSFADLDRLANAIISGYVIESSVRYGRIRIIFSEAVVQEVVRQQILFQSVRDLMDAAMETLQRQAQEEIDRENRRMKAAATWGL